MPQEYRLYLAPSRREGAGLHFVCPVPKRKGERSSIRLVLPVCKTACRTGRNRIRGSLYRRHKDREHSESVYLSLLRKREILKRIRYFRQGARKDKENFGKKREGWTVPALLTYMRSYFLSSLPGVLRAAYFLVVKIIHNNRMPRLCPAVGEFIVHKWTAAFSRKMLRLLLQATEVASVSLVVDGVVQGEHVGVFLPDVV